ETLDDIVNLVRQRPGHGSGDAPQIVSKERWKQEVCRGGNRAQGVSGRDLFAAEARDEQDMAPPRSSRRDLPSPARKQLDGELVGPLAIIDEHRCRASRRSQRGEQRGEGFEAARLAKGLR